ncbi:MAG: lipoyl(octanoyl) transferase LipB [Holosporales bacterium]|jgi:lipoyl(octanoyl) transferase|nr:lipoyl(octanoyl) transferase LipB [Holosporales bacterium]
MDIARFSGFECVFMVEHEGVVSAGRSFEDSDFLKTHEKVYHSSRGGRVTIHNPGQLIVYPVINLRERNINVGTYVDILEKWIIDSLKEFGIIGSRSSDGRGVWVSDNTPGGFSDGMKIGFVGIKIENGIAYHGLCVNVNNDLSPFKNIIPCGIQNISITSISEMLKTKVSVSKAKAAFTKTCPFD